jgi:hypothetical protein
MLKIFIFLKISRELFFVITKYNDSYFFNVLFIKIKAIFHLNKLIFIEREVLKLFYFFNLYLINSSIQN